MICNANPPILLRDVIADTSAVVGLLERNAPYTPLGGWYRPGVADDVPTNPMWFQNDWVHADLQVPGSELFLWHEEVLAAARRFYDAEVILPHSVYVNLMAGIAKCGPAHTDNPFFQGRDRTNTPMWLLRTMFWSGLFDRWAITEATSIWWMNDVEGGGLRYWPDGPGKEPQRHIGGMANTALVGDNHGMFHQVEAVGPFDPPAGLVTSSAELAPAGDGSGDWAVTDRGEVRFRAPLETVRVSVLWKAHVYRSEEQRRAREADSLTLDDVARIFDEGLAAAGSDLRLDLGCLDDSAHARALAEVYPEATPVGAGPSIFDG
jgi:hypothetical protein